MKKALLIILALVLCLSLCACGNSDGDKTDDTTAVQTEPTLETEPEPQIETVSFDKLIEDSDNEAKKQLNVGKKATVFAQVRVIKSDYCSVDLFHKKTHSAKIKLPTEVLAEMKVKQIIAVTAMIDSIESSQYVFKADGLADLSLLETYIKEKLELVDERAIGASLNSEIKNLFGMSYLYDYLEQSGSPFCTLSNADLEKYLLGTWFYGYAAKFGLKDETIKVMEDGTYIWTFNKQTSGLKKWVDDEQEEEWSVTNSGLDLSHDWTSYDKKVYILSDKAFIWSRNLYTKAASK